MIAYVGVFAALTLLIVLALRGTNILIASILSGAVVAVSNGQQLAEALTVEYSGAMFRFAQQFFFLFLTGAVFGRIMGASKAATSIAHALTRFLGLDRALLIIVLSAAILTYGGVNVFIVVFTMYPLGLGLLQRANLPKRLFAGAIMLGAGTFTMTAMPGTPSIQNNIPAAALKTSLSAGWGLGLIASSIMLGVGLLYLEIERRKAKRRGEGFEGHPLDPLPDQAHESSSEPHWLLASTPPALVLATILIPQWLSSWWNPAQTPEEHTGTLEKLMQFSQSQPLFWTAVALTLGTAASLLLFRKRLGGVGQTLSRGAEDAVLPLLNTSAVIGFGGVVKATAIFAAFESVMVGSNLNPILSAVLSVNVFAGIVGSASGGLGIFMETLASHYLEAGVNPNTLHRLAAIGCGGLDSLPHCGAVITFLSVMRLTHKQAYKEIAITTILIPLFALVVVTAIALAAA